MTASKIINVAVGGLSKINGQNKSGLSGILGVPFPSGTPSLPAFSNIAGCWALWNFNPSGYSGSLVDDSVSDFGALLVAPYPVDYATLIAGSDPPPYPGNIYDQHANANILNGFNDPSRLQITTPVIVTGGSQPGTYTYRGIANNCAYYNLVGQPTNPALSSLYNEVGDWAFTDSGGATGAVSDGDATFPWLTTWLGAGISVSAGTQTGEIDFGTDGLGNTETTGLQSPSNLCNSGTGTIYILFKAGSLSATEVLFETGTGAAGAARAKQISVSLVAGVLTATIYDNTAITPLPNSKIKTISDTNWHLITLTWDVSLAAGSQVGLKLDNSTSGVTSSTSATLAGLTIGNGLLNVGARNNAASAPFTGSMQAIRVQTNADDATAQTAMYAYCKYLQPALP